MQVENLKLIEPRAVEVRRIAKGILKFLRNKREGLPEERIQKAYPVEELRAELSEKFDLPTVLSESFARAIRELLATGEIQYDLQLGVKFRSTSKRRPEPRDERAFPDRDDQNRTEGERDKARIIQSSEFKRLSSTTQVASPHELPMFHNRLTHSLLVAETAKRFAQRLFRDYADDETLLSLLRKQVDLGVVEAAGLAHDLGHPPFGHVGEMQLESCFGKYSDWVEGYGGFEGNAQSFRIVTRLASRSRQDDVNTRDTGKTERPENLKSLPHGLNLTRATLNAIAKYPWPRHLEEQDPFRHRKWNVYDDDKPYFDFAQESVPSYTTPSVPTIEAQIMDWADDIAYSIHDLTDFYKVGFIPLEDVVTNRRIYDNLCDQFIESRIASDLLVYSTQFAKSRRDEIYDNLLQLVPLLNFTNRGTIATGDFHQFTEVLTARYLNKDMIKLTQEGRSEDPRLILEPDQAIQFEVEFLKFLTRFYVIDHPSLGHVRAGQRRIIEDLFEYFFEAVSDERLNDLPIQIVEGLETTYDQNGYLNPEPQDICRVVCDFIAALTEDQAIALRERLYQASGRSVLDPIVR